VTERSAAERSGRGEQAVARLTDQLDGFVMERIFSPDRRLALDYLPFPDPRTRYEVENPEAVALRNAETGAVLAEFGGANFLTFHQWPEAGGVELEVGRTRKVVIAPDLETFGTNDAAGQVRPIAALPDWLRATAPKPQPPSPPSRGSQAGTFFAVFAVLALLGYGLTWVPALIRGEAPARPASRGIDAWLVRCPGIGLAPMSLTSEGSLRVPRAIAPKPLPPLDRTGRRFGDGRVAVEVDGTEATWWPRGLSGDRVECYSSSREQGERR